MSTVPTETKSAQRRVLIVDDDPLVGVLMENIARLDGAQVRLLARPEALVQTLLEWAPTHLVLDLSLPGTSGEALLQQIGSAGCPARIVLSSGADAKRVAQAAALAQQLGLNLVGILPKPFLPAALRKLLV